MFDGEDDLNLFELQAGAAEVQTQPLSVPESSCTCGPSQSPSGQHPCEHPKEGATDHQGVSLFAVTTDTANGV
jgi:hypothetical protein